MAIPLETSFFFRLATTSAGVNRGPAGVGSVAVVVVTVSSVGVDAVSANVGGGDSDDGVPAPDIV